MKTPFILTICCWLTLGLASANDESRAAALASMSESTIGWTRQCERAFARFVGVPEERLRDAVPGYAWPEPPDALVPLLSGDPAAIEQLVPLLKDQRESAVHELDMLGRPQDDSRLSVASLADSLLFWLVPLGALPADVDEKDIPRIVEEATRAWSRKAITLKPEERLPAWFEAAADEQRRMALAFFIMTAHQPAWPLIENSLLKRAKAGEEVGYIILEAAAYVRHRRQEAAPFLEKLTAVLDSATMEEEYGPFFAAKEGRFMLVEPFSAAERVQQFLDGKLTRDDLSEWVIRGLDQPWAYHSVGIEPASVHLPHVDNCLTALLDGAAGTQDLWKKLDLLQMAEGLCDTRNDICRHARKDELRPLPAPTDPSQCNLVKALRTLLADEREGFENEQLVSVAGVAGQCVWSRWGTNTRHLDTVFHDVPADWRGRAEDFPRELPSLAAEAAVDMLDDTQPMQPEAFPEQEARGLAETLLHVSMTDWPQRLQALTWRQKLLFCEQAGRDEVTAKSVWPRMLRWYQLKDVERLPASFRQLWKEKCEAQILGKASFDALREWMLAEAAQSHRWAMVVEGSPCSPGLTLHLCTMRETTPNTAPKLRSALDGTNFFMMREVWRFENSGWSLAPKKYSTKEPSISEVIARLEDHMPRSYEKKAQAGIFRLVFAWDERTEE